jgi:hypothetical protein
MTTVAGKQHIAEFGVGQFGRVERAVAAIEQEAVDVFRGECLMMGIDLGPMSGEAVQRSLEAIKRAYREYMG